MDNSSFSVVRCLSSPEPQPILFVTSVVKMVLVYPPSLYILFLAVRQCLHRPQSSASPTSHLDFFTFHMISLELMIVLGISLCFSGYFRRDELLVSVGFYCTTLSHCLEMLVHCLTCIDRYLAVVHPITYLKLKKANGTRARNAAMACAWLLCLVYICALSFNPDHMPILFICLLAVNLSIISFCSVSVLRVLLRPGPSDVDKVDSSKRKALSTITAIMAVLLFWLIGIFVSMSLQHTDFLSVNEKCLAFVSVLAFNIPSQLVLPLLYLKRKGKIPCCKKK